MTAAPKNFVNSLQALRFVAALMVLVYHLELELERRAFATSVPFVDLTHIYWAVGVDVFFIVSGFIMYFVSAQRFGQPGAVREFLSRRIVRVVPLYWIFTTVFLIIALALPQVIRHSDVSFARTLTSYLFIPWPNERGGLYPILVLGWTLNYEIFFYLVFALGLLLPRRQGLWFVLGTLSALVALGPFIPSGLFILRFFTRPIILEFGVGVLLGVAYMRGIRLRTASRLALCLIGVAGLVVFGRAEWHDPTWRPIWAGLPCLAIAAGVVLGTDLRRETVTGRSLILVGSASYSLYLTHMFAMRLLTLGWTRFKLEGGWVFFAAGLLACVGLALATYFLVELPVLALFRRVTVRRPPRDAAPVEALERA